MIMLVARGVQCCKRLFGWLNHYCIPFMLAACLGRVPQEVCYYLVLDPALKLVSPIGVGS